LRTATAAPPPAASAPNYTPAAPEPTSTPAAEPNVALSGPEPTAAPETAGEPGLGGPIVMNVAVPLILGAVHDEATRAIRDQRGYAPVGPLAYAHEGFISRVGRAFTGAAVEEQTADLPSRFNVTSFRANARAQAARVAPGAAMILVCQVPIPREGGREVGNYVMLYRKGADGSWRLDAHPPAVDQDDIDTEHVLVAPLMPVLLGGGAARVDPPDMDVILGSGSDRDVARMMHVLPPERSTP
jgi:hypothetical protein